VARDAAVARDRREVDQLGVGECGALEETGECREIADECFRRDLLLQVVRDVRLEQPLRPRRLVDAWQEAMVDDAIDVEVRPELGGGEAVHLVAQCPSAEQVCPAALHLPGTRPAASEAESAVLDQPVDLVEERRNFCTSSITTCRTAGRAASSSRRRSGLWRWRRYSSALSRSTQKASG
jgi:hypothetical protein